MLAELQHRSRWGRESRLGEGGVSQICVEDDFKQGGEGKEGEHDHIFKTTPTGNSKKGVLEVRT